MVRRARSRLIGHPVCSAPVWRRAERMDLSEAATWPLAGKRPDLPMRAALKYPVMPQTGSWRESPKRWHPHHDDSAKTRFHARVARLEGSLTAPYCSQLACRWSREVIILRYDSGMSDRKSRLTITVDPDLSSYAERLVESGHAASVSAAFNEAMAEKAYRDRRRRSLWKAKGDQADPSRVARMMAHVDQQLAGE